jgi:hypothetical protein
MIIFVLVAELVAGFVPGLGLVPVLVLAFGADLDFD